MKTKLSIICGLMVLIGCNDLKDGIVQKKEIEPARYYPIVIPIRIGEVTTFIPVMMYDDEDYYIVLDGKNKQGESKSERFYVKKSTYNKLKIGQYFCIDADCSTSPNDDIETENKP